MQTLQLVLALVPSQQHDVVRDHSHCSCCRRKRREEWHRCHSSVHRLVLWLLEERVELTRLVDGVALEVGHTKAELAPRGTRLALVMDYTLSALLVEVHVRVLEEVAHAHARGGYDRAAGDQHDGNVPRSVSQSLKTLIPERVTLEATIVYGGVCVWGGVDEARVGSIGLRSDSSLDLDVR